MGKEILTYGDIETEKDKLLATIILLFFKKDVDIEKVLVCNKISIGEKYCKYLIGYLYNDHKIKPLHITLPKTNAYVKSYDGQSKWNNFLIEDDGLLEKYNAIWDKVKADIKKSFILSKPVYNK